MSAILLHPDDNILVITAAVKPGDTVIVGGTTLTVDAAIGVGHKIARRALEPGEKVLKYGASIGSMTRHAAPGAWVHLHNMKSDYIASTTRDAVEQRNPS
ncbi:UxaA family hydrolase [Stakelama saccharophila]|uniref:UxaA family hydrolase n=1 Tax=Stakelama saccharophila TaxID=3075605 RepID=A0ABZ0B7J9_9SPHN|nr:UxaA family hydrolase [Stakelama sp. W311]WNO52838.1 UxaA family hydrolase [Stakelama sp. W311]